MNRNLLKSLILGLTLFAGAGTASAGWIKNVEVKQLVVVATGGINVRVSPDLDSCAAQSGYKTKYASIYPDHPGLSSMHANLLAAMATGAKVSLYISDAKCTVTEMIIGGSYNSPY